MSLPEVVMLDGDSDRGFGDPHSEESSVHSSDVELLLDLSEDALQGGGKNLPPLGCKNP
jgi:hypothetical protein